jgi:hypothetical protein
MKHVLHFAILLLALASLPAAAQLVIPGTEEILHQPTWVLILRDGEQIVIRGDYEVKGPLTYFYYDHGSYPTWASMPTEAIDLDATRAANEKLKRERQKRENYYRLIEERRRRILEEDEDEQPTIIAIEGDAITMQPGQRPSAQAAAPQTLALPPYEENDVVNRPENWWRGEAQRLFTALGESNARLSELSRQNDQVSMEASRARTDVEAQRMRARLNDIRSRFAAERERGRLIGNRLAELSDWAEQLAIPMDWIIPDGSYVIDESPRAETPAAQPEPGEAAPAEYEPRDYSTAELRNVTDAWWTREMNRLQVDRGDAESRLNSLRNRYNALVAERENSASEGQRLALTQQIETLSGTIRSEERRLADVSAKIERIIAAARELGKEEVLGLMIERKDQ